METQEYTASANLQTSSRKPHATVEELRMDVAWEARHGIADFVGCRHCGEFVKTPIWQRHLGKHQMTTAEYRALYPGARLWSFAYLADRNGTTGQGHLETCELMTNFAQLYVTGIELIEYRKDDERSNHDYVVCLLCGRKVREWFGTHLQRIHQKMTIEEYLRKWPNAPTRSELMRNRHAETSRRNWHLHKQEVKQAKSDLQELAELRALRESGMLAPKPTKANVGGRPEGMSDDRQKKARELLRYIQSFIDKQGHDDGSIPHAAVKAYPGIARETAIERAKSTLKAYRKFIGGQKPPR